MTKIGTVSVPRKLPVVLARQEVNRLIDATSKPKYRAALSLAYGAGLRVSAKVWHLLLYIVGHPQFHYTLFSTKTAFNPPKANELEITTSVCT